MRQPTEEMFLRDVEKHELQVVHDDGVHRHLHFAQPGTGVMHFDIITYPGHLVYSGDMGCFVFSRLRDMLEFFRERPGKDDRLYINLSYWAEKLQATDRPDGHCKFDPETFERRVKGWLDDNDASDELREAVDDEVLSVAHDGETRARDALYSFEYDGKEPFADSWEWDFDEYTFRFIWCCYALAWAVRKYDAQRSPQTTVSEQS